LTPDLYNILSVSEAERNDCSRALVAAVQAKINEQLERTAHLIRQLPDDRVDWTGPVPGAWPTSILIGHLLECVAGICAVLTAAEPEQLAHFKQLRSLPVNHRCAANEAVNRLALYGARIDEGFALLTDADLGRLLPTVFIPAGEPILTLLLGNLEHLINHKHQLFMSLKLMGVDVNTSDLYQFRGE
jgi:hypothetical protein